MGQAAFYPDLDRLLVKWATPIPGNVTVTGGPIRTGSELFRREFQTHKRAIFEQLMLFDSINLSVTGPNVHFPLLFRAMGGATIEELLDQRAVTFVVWATTPMMSHDDDGVKATFVGRIGDGKGSELDVEQIVDNGLRIQDVGMTDSFKRTIRTALIEAHTLIDQKIPESAWDVSLRALRAGELTEFGLSRRDTIIGDALSDGQRLLDITNGISEYRYALSNNMISQNNDLVFGLFEESFQKIREMDSPLKRFTIISEYEIFPDLRSLYGCIDRPFDMARKFRTTHTAKRFREWLTSSPDVVSEVDVIRDYVNACSNRRKLFESAPSKFLKIALMAAIGQFVTPESHLLGAAVGAVLSGVPAPAIDGVFEAAKDMGLGVIDSFIVDNLKIGWTPKAYFDRLHRVQRRANVKFHQ